MQRLFSMFPAGWPGIALLILRNCIAAALSNTAFASGWLHGVFLLMLSMLCLGFLTPAVCCASLAAMLADLPQSAHAGGASLAIVMLSTFSLALLGPGAYSIDARLFGRRIVVSSQPASSDDERPRGS